MQKMLHCVLGDRKKVAEKSDTYYFIVDGEEIRKNNLHLGEIYELEIKEVVAEKIQ